MIRYDLIAIGGGTAGLVTAAGAASLGLKVALVERQLLGGDCLWTGCVPSKALIASAKLAHQMRQADALGLTGCSPTHVFATVMQRMRAARDRIAVHDDPARFRKLGVDVLFGDARFTGPTQIAVNGDRLESRRIVIATGATPIIPDVPGLGGKEDCLTYETAFERNELPDGLIILGGGPIGLEFAQIYSRLGATVTVVEMLPRVLPREDADASAMVQERLVREGITIETNTKVNRISRCDGRVEVWWDRHGDPSSVRAHELFVAVGRAPNTRSLDLDHVGVQLDHGAVQVDDTLRSTVDTIWAAGDVAGGAQFTHVADYQAKLVLRNALYPLRGKTDYAAVPRVTYTDPEVAQVGLTEEQARQRFGDDVHVYRYGFEDLDRAIVDGEAHGFAKIVTGRRSRIVGATIVASGAGNLIVPVVLAMKQGLSIGKLSQIVFPYPTMAEGIKRAADNYYRHKLRGRSGDWLRKVTGWLT